MKKGINEFGFKNGLTREQEFAYAAKADFDGIELNLSSALTEAELCEIKKLSVEYGVEVIGFVSNELWDHHLTSNDPSEREKAKDLVRMLIEYSVIMGCDSALVVPGVVSDEVSYTQAWNNAKQALSELKPFIMKKKINVCIENVWNRFLTSPFDMARFTDELDCPYIRSYFDAGNVLINAYPEHWIEILGNRIKRIHVKDFRRDIGTLAGFVDLGEGDMDWEALMKAVRASGYDGYITVEVPSGEKNQEEFLGSCSRFLDKVFLM